MERDHRTIKKFVTNPDIYNERFDKAKICKKAPVSHRAMGRMKREVRRNPLKTSNTVFQSLAFLMCLNQLDAIFWKTLQNVGKQRFALH